MARASLNGVNGLLLSLALCMLVGMFFAGGRDAPEPLPPPKTVFNSDVIRAERPLDTETSLAPEATPAAPAETSPTQAPRPDFQLIGTLIAPPMTRSAIIARADEELVVSPGEAIDGQWTLHQVFPGKIVIRNADRELNLGIRAQAPAAGDLRDAPIEVEAVPHDPGASHVEKMKRYYASRAPETVAFPEGLNIRGIENVSGQSFSVDVNALLDQFLLTPPQRHFDFDTDAVGLRFVEIVPGGVVDRFGFVPGDTITRINDTRITAIEDLQCLLQSQKNRVEVEFRRAGTPVVHSYLLH